MATIRAFAPGDYDAVFAIWNATEGLEICEGDSKGEIAQYLQRNQGLSHVAEVEGRIVGAVLCGHDGRRGWIYHLTVLPEYRGRGIAQRLIDRCVTALREIGIRRAIILVAGDNARGHAFWVRNGWEDIPGAIPMTREI